MVITHSQVNKFLDGESIFRMNSGKMKINISNGTSSEKEEVLLNCGDGLLDAGALKDCQNATCFLYCNTQETTKNATGFFASIEIQEKEYHVIVTNNHVFSSKEEAMNGVARFYYEGNMQGADARLRPDLLFYTDKVLDYTIMGCDHDQIENTFCINPIKFESEQDLKVGDNVFIFQHPRGETKKFSYEAISRIELPFVYYNADTDVGSSGSCVLRNLKLVALHSKGSDVLKFNKGVLCSEILNHLNHGKYTLPNHLCQHNDCSKSSKNTDILPPASYESAGDSSKRKSTTGDSRLEPSSKVQRLSSSDEIMDQDICKSTCTIEITETLLDELSKDIIDCWKSLGRKLEVKNSKLMAIHRDHVNYEDVREKAFAMLVSWKDSCVDATAHHLKSKLVEQGKVATANQYFPVV